MRIVIDMQGAQGVSSQRGIGRYTLLLVREMIRQRGGHEVILALNGLLPDTAGPLREDLEGFLSRENIRVWEAAGPVNASDRANEARRRAAEISREAFLDALRPDIVLSTSLFEGFSDNAVTSVGSFTRRAPTAVILYDLIPLIHQNIYFQNPELKRWYLDKLDHLRNADLLLSISDWSRREAIELLNIPREKTVNISAACGGHFREVKISEGERAHLRERYGIIRPFVMYTGGMDPRKNTEGMVRAYAGLPAPVRSAHQLAIVCSMNGRVHEKLMRLAAQEGLAGDEIVITDFVPEDDLLALYSACKLFVFPSLHEGFGLPVLEAMACGRAVLGSNTSSVPEVIGREDALFDPLNSGEMTRKMVEALTDGNFRGDLERHGLFQAKRFSWERTAGHAWQALETVVAGRQRAPRVSSAAEPAKRPRLAYIAPLPPAQSGIADYSAELIPELSRLYEVDVVVDQEKVSDPWLRQNCSIRSVDWFRGHARRFDRVLYHFGNSSFHRHMFDLAKEFPGVVVLHDFFLSGIVSLMEDSRGEPYRWSRALLHAHGWPALLARYRSEGGASVVYNYPCNLEVLQRARGAIVHSEYSRQLAREWYGPDADADWAVIPHLRVPAVKTDKQAARRAVKVGEKEFLVCCFGMLMASKLNHRLLAAWMASPLAKDPQCRLVFVGGHGDPGYSAELREIIRKSGLGKRVRITGRADRRAFRNYLAAADMAVQLRSLSRGETSGAVLDCMNHALPTVVNAHGSAAELPSDSVWLLPDKFSDEELIEALISLRRDALRRREIGCRARNAIHEFHQPRRCAELYARAIENFYHRTAAGLPGVLDSIGRVKPPLPVQDRRQTAVALANNFPPHPCRKQLLLDISELVQRDSKSGIQRVVRSLLQELLINPPEGWSVEPVHAPVGTGSYYYARKFTSRFLGVPDEWAADGPVDAYPGDVFLGLDLNAHISKEHRDCLFSWHRRGIKIFFVVHDLLTVLSPQFFVGGTREIFTRWFEMIARFDGAICVSRTVAEELADWRAIQGPACLRPFKIGWFHHGADLDNSVPSRGLPADAGDRIKAIKRFPAFLMVGTVEPRKGHAQTLDAFEILWKEGMDISLVIVGKQGWMVEPLAKRLRHHPELNRRLFWLEGISDEYLVKIYKSCTCLIMASQGEGFGLPLIEAAQHRLPIMARDIPVFREVAGEYAFYFSGLEPGMLADAVRQWLELDKLGLAPASDSMPRQTWRESARQLLQAIDLLEAGDGGMGEEVFTPSLEEVKNP